ncbi:hypothetical protein ABH935_007115 [Catenulispora sp. GAS73]|uniref:hypothetical protein n=1 Tax=Catenulispora sp. GAS73 TaxID=3156269 RepID=UPI003518614B
MTRKFPEHEAIEIMRRAGVEPLDPYPGCDTPWRCRCLNEECPGKWDGELPEVTPTMRQARISAVSACKYCARVAVHPKVAEQQMIARGITPKAPYVSAWAHWLGECQKCEQEVTTATYANVVLNGQGGCERCAGHMRVPEEQAVAEMLAANAKPLEPYPNVNARWRCLCLNDDCPGPEDRVIFPRLTWVRRGSKACKWCAGVVIDPQRARDLMTRRGFEPLEDYPGVREPWRCRCRTCGNIVKPSLSSITGKPQGGCNTCAEYGFKRGKPALVYLMINRRLRAAKVGVCNIDSGRIEKHQGRGWELYKTVPFELGQHAEDLETEVLVEWRSEGREPVYDDGNTYDGYTETVPLEDPAEAALFWQDIVETSRRLASS